MFFDKEYTYYLKQSVDVEELLIYLGFKATKTTDNQIRACCKIHGGDNPSAFSIFKNTGSWCCFTRKCEDGAVNDVFGLVMKVEQCTFVEAVSFLAKFTGIYPENVSSALSVEQKIKTDTKRFTNLVKKTKTVNLPLMSESLVDFYKQQRDGYFLKQGFCVSTLDRFEIGSKLDEDGIKRATVPIRDHKGNLVSISGRRVDSDEEPRYRLERNFKKCDVLYNFYDAVKTDQDTVIIVEGFKALWAVYEAGFSNVVACMGKDIGGGQEKLLYSSKFSNCLILFDGDSAGITGAERVVCKLSKGFKVIPIFLSDNCSPDSLPREDLRELISFYLKTL